LVHLLSSRAEVIATSKGDRQFSMVPGVIYQSIDITKEEQVQSVFDIYQPEAVIHTAAMTQVDQCELNREICWQVNVNGTRLVAEAALRSGAYLIHLSTDFIFDGEAGPYNEEATPAPVNYYGESKLAAERIIQELSSDWVIIRTILVYGWLPKMARSNIVLWVMENLEQHKTIRVVDDHKRTPTLVEDLAKACSLVLDKKVSGIFNISGGEFLTPFQMAIQTARFFQLDETLIQKTDSIEFVQPAKRPMATGFIITKAQNILGYEPHTFSEGLAILAQQIDANKEA